MLFSAAYRSESGLRALWDVDGARLLTSDYALREAERNLERDDQRQRLTVLIRACEIVPTPLFAVLPQRVVLPDADRPILLAAVGAQATQLLTGDKMHFGRFYGTRIAGVLILPPAAYLHARRRQR